MDPRAQDRNHQAVDPVDIFPNADQLGDAAQQAAPAATPLVLTIEEAARRLGIGRTLMYALVKAGQVESVTIGRLRRIPADALDTFVESLRKSKTDEAA